MDVRFKDDCTLVIVPTNSVEAMALRYWAEEYKKHGDKMLDVDLTVPIRLPDLT